MHWFGIGLGIGFGLLLPVALMIALYWLFGVFAEIAMEYGRRNGLFEALEERPKKKEKSKSGSQKIKMGFM